MSVHVTCLRRPVHGTDNPVPSMGPIVFVSCFATYLPHLVTEEKHNIKFLARIMTKEALTVSYGNATTRTKLRAGKGLPTFASLCKAKFWREEGWDTYRRQVSRERHITPSTQASHDGILTVKVELAGVDTTVAFVKHGGQGKGTRGQEGQGDEGAGRVERLG